MELETVVNLISTVGFPIVCCIALFWKMGKQDENHRQEIDSLRQSLDNNTNVITKLYERLTDA